MAATDRIRGVNASLAVKAPCRAATTANITLSGLQAVDGVALAADDRVLVKDQTAGYENGIYRVSSTAWSRASDFDGARDATEGSLVFVTNGTVAGDNFYQVTTSGTIDIGATPITFAAVTFPATPPYAYSDVTGGPPAGATVGGTLGTNIYNEGATLIGDIDVTNDLLVGTALGGSLLANPRLDISRVRNSGSGSRPQGWYLQGHVETNVAYSSLTRDTVDVTHTSGGSVHFISQAMPVNAGTRYEIVVVARSDNSDSISLAIDEDTSAPTAGYAAFMSVAAAGYTDSQIQAGKGTAQVLTALALNGTLTAYARSYTPTAGTTWANLRLVIESGEHIELDSIWMRSSSTYGATVDTSLFDSDGTLGWVRGVDATFAWNYDGTDYQPQRTEQIKYTYDVGGTYTYNQGSASADADREFPWVDVPLTFYRGTTLIKTINIRTLVNYGREDSNARIGSKIRAIYYSTSGSAADGDFTVAIAGGSARTKWNGALYSSTHDIYLAANYGGDLAEFTVVATHTATGKTATLYVALSAIVAVAPFYDSGGGGGGYK